VPFRPNGTKPGLLPELLQSAKMIATRVIRAAPVTLSRSVISRLHAASRRSLMITASMTLSAR